MITVTLCHASAPRTVHETTLQVPAACTVAEAVARAGWSAALCRPHDEGLTLCIWGRAATADQALRDRDRVEWVRGLKVDPKLARRERFKGQGARTAGLFASRRAGSKAGY